MNLIMGCMGRQLLTSLSSLTAEINEDIPYNRPLEIGHRDTAVFMSTTCGRVAKRNAMIPILAENLQRFGGDIYEGFLLTSLDIQSRFPDQIPEFRSTLTKRLCISGNGVQRLRDRGRRDQQRCSIQ